MLLHIRITSSDSSYTMPELGDAQASTHTPGMSQACSKRDLGQCIIMNNDQAGKRH